MLSGILFSACKSSTSGEDEPTSSGTNAFSATVDGKSGKATKSSGGVAGVGGLMTIVGKLDDVNEIPFR